MSDGPSSANHGSVRLAHESTGDELAARGDPMSLHMSLPRRARRALLTFAAAGTMLALSALPAAAAPPGWSTAPGGANSNGVGFCVSQIAQFPDISVGTSSAGEFIREVATSGPGAVPSELEGARHPACGGPAAGD
jgi:hypothetical protein